MDGLFVDSDMSLSPNLITVLMMEIATVAWLLGIRMFDTETCACAVTEHGFLGCQTPRVSCLYRSLGLPRMPPGGVSTDNMSPYVACDNCVHLDVLGCTIVCDMSAV